MFFQLTKRTVMLVLIISVLFMFLGCSIDSPISSTSQNDNLPLQKAKSTNFTTSEPSVPSEGIVIEGESVPGVSLGDTRAMVEASYGDPYQVSGTNRNNYKYKVANGGDVGVAFQSADGSEANNSPDDIVISVGWYEAVSGWVTTAGVNTTLADEDPEAVVAAYPNARVTYNLWGGIYSIIDYEQGIAIYRPWILYSSGEVHIHMSIFNPREAPPLPEKITYVYTIDLSANKDRGKRQIQGFVGVRDQTQFAAKQAKVYAHWTYPDGSTENFESTTSLSGYAYFEIKNAHKGTYTLTVDDVVLEDYRFDSEKSVLSERIKVK